MGVKEKEKSVEKIIATVLEGKKRDAHNIEFKGIFYEWARFDVRV